MTPSTSHVRAHELARTPRRPKPVDVKRSATADRQLPWVRGEIHRIGLDGKPLGTVELPGLGTAGGFTGKAGDAESFYVYTSYTEPTSVYRLDLAGGRSERIIAPEYPLDTGAFTTRQVFYTSRDGTRVPMFIVSRRDLPLDGNNPTILYGYGGFNISQTPAFSAGVMGWLDRGGVYAVANLRGGGEAGRAWHEAGMQLAKQNVFDDFIAAAEHLIAERITSPNKLAIRGGSNGGLLVAAVELQRPDLFAAAVPAVGVLDMLRFREFTIGKAWESDFGSVKNADEFAAILKYSPLHNIQPGVDYPATLITTGDHDDRVFPAHSSVRRRPAGGEPAAADPHRRARRPRPGQADQQADRGTRRRLRLHPRCLRHQGLSCLCGRRDAPAATISRARATSARDRSR